MYVIIETRYEFPQKVSIYKSWEKAAREFISLVKKISPGISHKDAEEYCDINGCYCDDDGMERVYIMNAVEAQ